MDKPSVGRIVHYVAYGTPGGEFPAGVCRAAVITEVDPIGEGRDRTVPDDQTSTGYSRVASVGLCVLNPTGQFFNRNVPYDGGSPRCRCGKLRDDPVHTSMHPDSHDPVDVQIRHAPGTWHWPERV